MFHYERKKGCQLHYGTQSIIKTFPISEVEKCASQNQWNMSLSQILDTIY